MAKFNLILFVTQLITIILCYFAQISSTRPNKKLGGLKLKMVYIDSPNSPLYQPNLTDLERVKRWVAISDSRMRRLTKNVTHMSRNLKPDGATPQLFYDNSFFYVELGLGKFRNGAYQSIYVIFDTASDFMWTQCEDCTNCFHQSSPYFARKSSVTYRSYPCNECPGGQCSQDHCTYERSYGDGTHVRGIWARDKLTLVSSFYNQEFISKFTFVCAIDIQNFPSGRNPNNVITGNVGMGNGRFSLLSQLGTRANYQFSYCLQDPQGREDHYLPMFLRFGDDIERLPYMVTTPLFTVDNHADYFLVLNDISVNGINLNIPDHLFRTNPDYSGGTIIDSGSTLSYLVPEAFNIVFRAISSYMNNNNPYLRTSSISIPGVSACWEPLYDSPYVNFPTLTFHLEDADLYVDAPEMMIIFPYQGVNHPGLYCLTVAMAAENGVNMIGAYHQINQCFIYDVGNEELSFAKDNCATRG
ncbi:hypothetical protein RND81_09G210700 [Saponaria officinalis]|uniref:Peptidase A1 domain-containing protein n=1 Tax=Saponaria officinalis TaxID=3572 RepID=A0AAW1IPP0_SAPOF